MYHYVILPTIYIWDACHYVPLCHSTYNLYMGRLSLCIIMSFYLQPISGTLFTTYHDVILPTTYIWDACHVSIRSDDIFYKADPTHLHLIHVSIMISHRI